MIKLLMIADDFSGALDAGVQFAARGAATRVVTDLDCDFLETDAEVLVMVAETRHLPPQKAYDVVYHVARNAREAGVPYIYKKTDSALRGNVGSELAAVMDAAAADVMPFLPAFPKLNRVTRNGVHYVDGVPVAESIFGQDPFEPVTVSFLPDILSSQPDKPTVIHRLRGDSDLRRRDRRGPGAAEPGAGNRGSAYFRRLRRICRRTGGPSETPRTRTQTAPAARTLSGGLWQCEPCNPASDADGGTTRICTYPSYSRAETRAGLAGESGVQGKDCPLAGGGPGKRTVHPGCQ